MGNVKLASIRSQADVLRLAILAVLVVLSHPVARILDGKRLWFLTEEGRTEAAKLPMV
jgi:hypothetical protein